MQTADPIQHPPRLGEANSGASQRAPKPMAVNHSALASGPASGKGRPSPHGRFAMVPSSTTVSRYTWG